MKLHAREDATETLSQRPIPLYDAIQGLLEVKHAAFSHTDFAPVDHCIASVASANATAVDKPYARFLHCLSLTEPLLFGLPPGPPPKDRNVLQEDATLRLLSRDTSFENFPHEAIERCVEICVRLTAWMYGGKEGRMCRVTWDQESISHATQSLPIQWVAHALEKYPLGPKYTQGAFYLPSILSVALILRLFLQRYDSRFA